MDSFRWLDVLLALALLFNFCNVLITNVVAVDRDSVVVEANPVQAKNLGKQSEAEQMGRSLVGWKNMLKEFGVYLKGFWSWMFFWGVFVGLYCFVRVRIEERGEFFGVDLATLTFLVVMLWVMNFLNFGNDLGFFLGKFVFLE